VRQKALRVDASLVSRLFLSPAPPASHRSSVCKQRTGGIRLTEAAGLPRWQRSVPAEGFVPIAEQPSPFNTRPGQEAFGVYDGRLGRLQAAALGYRCHN
jgi:hypothetical protein